MKHQNAVYYHLALIYLHGFPYTEEEKEEEYLYFLLQFTMKDNCLINMSQLLQEHSKGEFHTAERRMNTSLWALSLSLDWYIICLLNLIIREDVIGLTGFQITEFIFRGKQFPFQIHGKFKLLQLHNPFLCRCRKTSIAGHVDSRSYTTQQYLSV